MGLAPTRSYRWHFKLLISAFMVRLFTKLGWQVVYSAFTGRIECVYEPAMTKAFLHGRTEAIHSVQPESVEFIKVA